jgi:hypothetical protein
VLFPVEVALLIAAGSRNPNGHFMQRLIEQIVAETGLDAVKVEKAVGILLNLVVTQGSKGHVQPLLDKLPGAAALASKHGGDGAGGGGLMGILAGGMMGGPLAMVTKLQAIGLNTDQVKKVATMTFDHAKKTAGLGVVRAAAANVPGLNTYI